MKTKRKTILLVTVLVALAVVLSVAFFMQPARDNHIEDVTMIQLIATPERYHGKLVRVVGVGNLEFEGNAIYLSKDDISYQVYNAVWLDFDNNTTLSYAEAKKHNGKYVIVEGIFDKDHSGHMGLFHGAITNITRYELNLAEVELAETENVK